MLHFAPLLYTKEHPFDQSLENEHHLDHLENVDRYVPQAYMVNEDEEVSYTMMTSLNNFKLDHRVFKIFFVFSPLENIK